MPRLMGVREMRDWTFWDTLVSTDGPAKLDRRNELFDAKNLGTKNRTNMMYANVFHPTNTFQILSTPTLVSFHDESLYGVVARDAVISIDTGSRTQSEQRIAQTMVRGERPAQSWSTQEEFVEQYDKLVGVIKSKGLNFTQHRAVLETLYAAMPGALRIPIQLPPAQHFEVTIDLANDAHAVIGNAHGVKSIVQCLRGSFTRDVL